jgi:nucleoside triphosphate diphosphatase
MPYPPFDRLVEIVAALRAPDGCPWDREQTIDSLKPFILEETYELLEAIDAQDHEAIREELGDFLFEAVFVAQLEREAGHATVADALTAVTDKLVRRHPHVFARAEGEPPLTSGDQVRARWEDIKATERGADARPRTLLGGVPSALPALLRAYQIGGRVASVGFDWSRAEQVLDKIDEEVRELREVFEATTPDRIRAEEEMGDLLFSIANLARKLGIEPETALRKANEKFTTRFTAVERGIAAEGRNIKELTLAQLEERWQSAKHKPD